MKILSAVIALVLFFAAGVKAETTNSLSDAEMQGQLLVQKIMAQKPAESFTNAGVLKIKNAGGKTIVISIKFETAVTPTNWTSVYEIHNDWGTESLSVIFKNSEGSFYYYHRDVGDSVVRKSFSGNQTFFPFASSDFWACDFGLEFFRWPTQKVLKKEIHRSCACTVLESINPNLTSGVYSNGYSRVVSWIDNDSLGVVEAYAYDFNGKKLKNFYPKDIKKVNGQWQVQTLVMENLQTGSKSRIEFDLNE